MEVYDNVRAQNRSANQGNVDAYFRGWTELIQINDGTRTYRTKTIDCHDHNVPFTEEQETQCEICARDFDVTCLGESFLSFEVKLKLQMNDELKEFEDKHNLMQIFVGWKSSNQILDQLNIFTNGRSSGYQQNECIREGFAYANLMNNGAKQHRKFVHSLYDQVSEFSTNVCGTYVPLSAFKGGKTVEVSFSLNLPINNILALQAFDLWPSQAGPLTLKFYVKPKGLVWAMVNPAKVLAHKRVIDEIEIPIDGFSPYPDQLFRHAFTQIGNEVNIINSVKPATTGEGDDSTALLKLGTGKVRLDCINMEVTKLKSNLTCFNVIESTKKTIQELLSKGIIIPTQKLHYNAWNISSTPNMQLTLNQPLNNVTMISVMFPRNGNDYTCFINPFLQNLQLSINGENYPDDVYSTTSARFFESQMAAADLDGNSQPTKEYINSLTALMNNEEHPDQVRYKDTVFDNTSFMWNIATERSDAGYCWDGIDSNGANISIQIRAVPIYNSNYIKKTTEQGQPKEETILNGNNTYFVPDIDKPQDHAPAPQIWTCSDCYFVVSLKGLDYYDGAPPGSQSLEYEVPEQETIPQYPMINVQPRGRPNYRFMY